MWSLFHGPRGQGSHRALGLPKSMAGAMWTITTVGFFPLPVRDGSSRAVWQGMLPFEPVLGGWRVSSHTPSHGPPLGGVCGHLGPPR